VNVKNMLISALSCTLLFSVIFVPSPALHVVEAAATSQRITYILPANPEKYLFLNMEMVDIINPQTPALQRSYSQRDYLIDMDESYLTKTAYQDNLKFMSSKKGFLWNLYRFIGILPPSFPEDINLDELDQRIEETESFSEEGIELRQTRAQIYMNAHLQPLIDAGYVKQEEIDDGIASRQFVATVLYRMFREVRPYHGGIDLKDSEDTAVRWAVEIGLPGFTVDSKGYIYPQSFLDKDPGLSEYAEEYAYERLFPYMMFILPGNKTANGWEYYQIKLKPGMVPMRPTDVMQVNGKPFDDYSLINTVAYQQARKKIDAYFNPRFVQILDQARKDALKPRAWDWSRDLIHHPKFAKEVAAYRKNKSSKNLNAIYQAVRNHYNLSIPQDSAANIKSVLDNVK